MVETEPGTVLVSGARNLVVLVTSMGAPHQQQLQTLLTRLATLVVPQRHEVLPSFVAEALLAHLSRGLRTSRRALALPPTRDGLVLTFRATDDLRAAVAVLEEWSST